MTTLDILISHRVPEDSDIANLLRHFLGILGDKRVNVHISEKLSGGDAWRDWIIQTASKVQIALFLYTKTEANWDWCLFETAYFQGANPGGRLIGIKAPGLPPPPTFAHLTFCDGTTEGIRTLFMDLIEKELPKHATPIDTVFLAQNTDTLTKACAEISKRFMRNLVTTDYFKDRLIFDFAEVTPEKDTEFAARTKTANITHLLSSATITGSRDTLSILGIDTAATTWEEIETSAAGNGWMVEFREMLTTFTPGAESDLRRSSRQVYSSFVGHNGFRYLPVLGRMDRLRNYPSYVTIHLVKQTVLTDDDAEMRYRNIPPVYATIVILLRMGREFRWSFVEPMTLVLERARAEERKGGMIWEEVSAKVQRLMPILENLEEEGKSRNYMDPGYVAALLNEKVDTPYRELWLEYQLSREGFEDARTRKDIEGMLGTLERWLGFNKEFLKRVVERMAIEVAELRPKSGATKVEDDAQPIRLR